jgi:phosphoglycerate dehydrogenase-like enzyme
MQIVGQLGAERFERIAACCAADSFDGAGGPEVVFVWEYQRAELAALLAEHGDQVRWVHFRRVGIPPDVLRLFEPYPQVVLTNGSGASGVAVAEHALALMLALAKRLRELFEDQRQRTWERGFEVAELRGQTACVVGLGDVGGNIVRLLRALGMHCIGVRRQLRRVEEVDETVTSVSEPGVLERSRWLILAASLSDATRGMIGARELARLPRGSYVVNVGRGPLVDETALIEALRNGHLAGAGLDVVATEPLAAESALWSMPNVIVTPHAAAHTPETDDRSVDIFLHKLERFRRGEELPNRIDRP